jgi:hypothetical protein
MNPFTEAIWEVITDHPDYLKELTAILKREYKPFLSKEQAFRANAHALEAHIREEIDQWYAWLPDTPIHRIGGGLAVEMLDCVDWEQLAGLLQEPSLA